MHGIDLLGTLAIICTFGVVTGVVCFGEVHYAMTLAAVVCTFFGGFTAK